MAAAAALLNHQSVAQSLAGRATPMTSPTSGTSGSSGSSSSTSDSATISANDFLTLLVTEMQNQDPTADTDPNEYINQLVQVNSLEQLIDINQTLSTDLGSSPTTAPAASGSPKPESTTASPQASASTASQSAAMRTHAATQASQLPAIAQAPGNLGIPAASSAAQRVAHSLNGRSRAHPAVAPPVIP
jgi:flagellar basal-body rod modification protein FlgD